jgi:glycosyltransferase involved in cell wall biosynthesis
MFTTDTVTVVTAATGHRHLGRCVASVRRQTFAGVRHWVVVDGPDREAAVHAAVPDLTAGPRPPVVLVLPDPTGLQNWNGHRIYAAASFLVNTEFVCFLDEDNWFEDDHVESLVSALRAERGQWAFALRNIVDGDGRFLAPDQCESLGSLSPVYYAPDLRLVDLNCYLLPRALAVAVAPHWYQPARRGTDTLEPDYVVGKLLVTHAAPAATNRRHTVNYTVGNRSDSVQAKFFLTGNRIMRARYPQGMPWERG